MEGFEYLLGWNRGVDIARRLVDARYGTGVGSFVR